MKKFSQIRHDINDHDDTSSLNLTENQLLNWLEQKAFPNIPVCNMAQRFFIEDEIDLKHFQTAFQWLINNTDALRTVIYEVDGVPRQKFINNMKYSIELIDLSYSSDSFREAENWTNERCLAIFNSSRRLFDSVLLKLSRNQFIWYLCIHHIIIDAQSIMLIYRRVAELYKRSLQGEQKPLMKYPQFQDYVKHERVYRDSVKYLESKSYWNQKLVGNVGDVYFHGKYPLKTTTNVQRVTYNLGADRTRGLEIIAQKKDINIISLDLSLFSIFSSLLFVYLYRSSGNPSLSVGTSFHNRSSISFKETVGLLMEVCFLKVTLQESDVFLSVLDKVKKDLFNTLRYYRYSVGNSATKNYDVSLTYYNSSYPNFHEAPTKVKWIHTGHNPDSLIVQVHRNFEEANENLVIDFDFHCDVFNTEQRQQAVWHFLQILDAFLAESSSPVKYLFD